MVNNIFDESCTNLDGFAYSIQDCEAKRSCSVKFESFWLTEDCQKNIDDEGFLGFIKLHCQGKDHKGDRLHSQLN